MIFSGTSIRLWRGRKPDGAPWRPLSARKIVPDENRELPCAALAVGRTVALLRAGRTGICPPGGGTRCAADRLQHCDNRGRGHVPGATFVAAAPARLRPGLCRLRGLDGVRAVPAVRRRSRAL